MYFLLQRALTLLNKVKPYLTPEQLRELEDLKYAVDEHAYSNFDNFNFD